MHKATLQWWARGAGPWHMAPGPTTRNSGRGTVVGVALQGWRACSSWVYMWERFREVTSSLGNHLILLRAQFALVHAANFP